MIAGLRTETLPQDVYPDLFSSGAICSELGSPGSTEAALIAAYIQQAHVFFRENITSNEGAKAHVREYGAIEKRHRYRHRQNTIIMC